MLKHSLDSVWRFYFVYYLVLMDPSRDFGGMLHIDLQFGEGGSHVCCNGYWEVGWGDTSTPATSIETRNR
jgi:hypothetical protein